MSRRNRKRTGGEGFAKFRTSNQVKTVHFFDRPDSIRDAPAGLCRAEFDTGEDGTLRKRALVMVEGVHIDSSKKRHDFPADRIRRIVKNTNAFLSKHGRIPWQKDHSKKQDDNIGDLESPLVARIITPEDLPSPRLRHLVGKLGAFTDGLVAKGDDILEQIAAGRIKTLSPGIDVLTDTIREISATPVPAIQGLMTFRRHQEEPEADESYFAALTMDEAEAERMDMSSVASEAHDLLDLYLKVFESIDSASEDELEGQDAYELQLQAVSDFMSRLQDLMGLSEEMQEEEQPDEGMATNLQGGSNSQNYTQKQQGVQMSNGMVLAAFSMSDMAKMLGSGEFRRPRRDRGRKRGRRRKKSVKNRLLGTTTAGRATRAAALTGLAALGGGAYLRSRGRGGGGSGLAVRGRGGLATGPQMMQVRMGDRVMNVPVVPNRMLREQGSLKGSSPIGRLPSARGTKGPSTSPNKKYRQSKSRPPKRRR